MQPAHKVPLVQVVVAEVLAQQDLLEVLVLLVPQDKTDQQAPLVCEVLQVLQVHKVLQVLKA